MLAGANIFSIGALARADGHLAFAMSRSNASVILDQIEDFLFGVAARITGHRNKLDSILLFMYARIHLVVVSL